MMDVTRIPVSDAFEIQDALPLGWRELIYDYGQTKVLALQLKGYDLVAARQILGAAKPEYCKPIRKCRR